MTALVDVAAERAALAILAEEGRILGPARAHRTIEELALRADDFTDSTHRAFFLVAEAAVRAGKALVPSVLGDGLPGFKPILEAQEFVSRAQLVTLADRLRDLSARRQMFEAARTLAQAAQDDALSVPTLLARFAEAAKNISGRGTSWRAHPEMLDRVVERIRRVQEGGPNGALRSGYAALDDVTGGFPPTLCVVVGLPGQAKSGLVASVVRLAARRREPTAVFCPEDRGEWLGYRWLAHESGVSQFALRNCRLPGSDWQALGAADAEVRAWPAAVHIDDRRGVRPDEILMAAREAYRDLDARAVFLDNMSSVPFARGPRMDLEIADFLDSARALADEFQRPFVVLAHAKRREGLKLGDIPALTDCRESAAYENFARMALGIAVNHEAKTVELGIHKNTNGAGVGRKVTLAFRGKSALLEDGA